MAGKTRVEFFGSAEILQKLEKAGANLDKVVIEAIRKGNEKPKRDMLDFIKRHRRTGITEASWVEEIEKGNDGVIYSRIGFSARKGGLPAIFLNLGGLHNEPYFFIDRAVEDNIDEIARIQREALMEAFKGLV